jgi:hypothetical protein
MCAFARNLQRVPPPVVTDKSRTEFVTQLFHRLTVRFGADLTGIDGPTLALARDDISLMPDVEDRPCTFCNHVAVLHLAFRERPTSSTMRFLCCAAHHAFLLALFELATLPDRLVSREDGPWTAAHAARVHRLERVVVRTAPKLRGQENP